MHSEKHDDSALPLNPHLLAAERWLVWKSIPQPDGKKPRKVPYYATGRMRAGTLDTERDIAKLTSYDVAAGAVGTKYAGLGFAVNSGFQFIDLDGVRDPVTTNVSAWVPPVLTAAIEMGAFVEVSVSGTGFHIVGYHPSGLPNSIPTRKGESVEVYTHGRFMALGSDVVCTGHDVLPDLAPLLPLLPPDEEKPVAAKPPLRLVTNPALLWPGDRQEAARALKKLDPGMDYHRWIKVGMALHKASGGRPTGLELWDDWSKGSEKKYVEGGCAKFWAGFKADGGVGLGTLLHMAQEVEEPISSPVIKDAPPTGRRKRASHRELMAVEHAPIPWAVEDLIAPGVTLLAAPPKTGKSYLVLQMALCVGAGVPFLGKATRKQRVSYFNLEEWEELLQPRARAVCAGNAVADPDVEYIFDMDLADDETFLDECQREIDAGSGLLIIDLLARVRDELREDAKKNAYARDYNALKAIADFILKHNPDVCIVIVHHTNKGNHEDWQNKISGSQGLAGATHTNMVMYGLDRRGVDDATRTKMDDYRRLGVAGKLVPQQELMLKKMPNGGGWMETPETEDEVKTYGTRALILQVLREADGRWLTAKEIKESVPGSLDSIKKMLVRMASKGEIVSGGTGGPGYRFVPHA